MAQWGVAAKSDNGGGVVKQTSQRSLLFRQNVNRTEAEWVHFLDGYRKALIEFDMKNLGDTPRERPFTEHFARPTR